MTTEKSSTAEIIEAHRRTAPRGEALNIGIERSRGRYVHVSENDIEYLPGWDQTLLAKLRTFPNLGQLSPYSPFPQAAEGEIWADKPAQPWSKDGMSIYVADKNLTTTRVVPREVYERGVRWEARSGKYRFPKTGGSPLPSRP